MRTPAASFVVLAALCLPADASSIGYPTVAAALEALRKDPNAHFETRGGWTVVTTTEDGNSVFWSFSPEGDPSYPAAVKRTLIPKDGAWYMDMAVLCGGPKAACDKLVEDFKRLNERMKESLSGHHGA
jgi:hypothetical protein